MSASKLFDTNIFEYALVEKPAKTGVLSTVGGIFQRADQKNANGRVYPRSLWEKVLGDKELQERIKNKQMLGMFGHPKDGQTDPLGISHIVTKQELRSDGTIYGESEIIDTPAGRVVDTLFRSGVKLGISSRGGGSVKKEGGVDEVQDDFELETYDFVLRPSTPGAFPELQESEQDIAKNELQVVKAIEGLVKSQLPAESRADILMECQKTLSVLESAGAVNEARAVFERIDEELAAQPPSPNPIIVITASESAPIPTITRTQEEDMPAPSGSQPALSESTLKWVEERVNEGVKAKVAEKDAQISKLNKTIVNMQEQQQKLQKEVDAAEKVIESLLDKNEKATEGYVSAQEHAQLRKRYDAAVDLLDEALKRLPEIAQHSRRIRTLEGLLEAGLAKFRRDKIEEARDAALSKIPESHRTQAKALFEGCRSVAEVEKKFKSLSHLVPTTGGRTSSRREPLPNMTESVETKSTTPTQTSGRSLTRRLMQAVGQ